MMINQSSVFLIISFFASGLSLFLVAYVWERRSASGAMPFILFMLCVSIVSFAIGAGMLSRDEYQCFNWIIVRMFGVVCLPVFWASFAIEYTRGEKILKPPVLLAMLIIPAVSFILIWTSHDHQLFIRAIQYQRRGGFLIDEVWAFGPWFWVHLLYSYGLTLFGCILILNRTFQLISVYRVQAIALLFAAVIPLVVNVLFSFHLIPGIYVDYDPLGFVFTGILLSFALFRHNLFRLKPIARRLLIENMSDLMIVLDADQFVVDLNKAAYCLVEGSLDNAIGRHIDDVLLIREKIADILPDHETDNTILGYEVTELCMDGTMKVYDVRISLIVDEKTIRKKQLGYLLVLRDISHRKQLEQQLAELAVRDSMTGLYNHRYFIDLAKSEFERTKRYQRTTSLVMLDVDDFKFINDQYGHLAGDVVLEKISGLLSESMRDSDIVARYGGEEFVMLLPETGKAGAMMIAGRIREAIDNLNIDYEGKIISVTASLGIAVLNQRFQSLSFEQFLMNADRALYEAKAGGKNCIVLWGGR